jgi:S-adenosylmethionine-diacylglycerol 3-amino-3-carboxypropyl transferase
MPEIVRLQLVDINPAQVALSRLKIRLLQTADISERLSILGHAPMAVSKREARLEKELQALNLPGDVLGPASLVAKLGPNRAGRYEVLFARLRDAFTDIPDDLEALLQLRDPTEQSVRTHPSTPLGRALDSAFDLVMSLPNLVSLFGEAATRNRVEPFSRHFARRTRHALATLPAADNPYLWQMLRGRFPRGIVHPWFSVGTPATLPEIQWTIGSMNKVLQSQRRTFDLIHLSNILDWLDPTEAGSILAFSWEALRPGGCVFIRQLNSILDIQKLGEGFEWDQKSGKVLHERDRSFFYRKLHVGRK